MKKSKLSIMILVMTILFTSLNISLADNSRVIKVWVDGNYIFSDVNPLIEKNRTQVPIRFIAEELGFDVKWIPETRNVKIQNGSKTLLFKIGSDKCTVNGKTVKLDNKVFIRYNRTFLPLRFISESFDKFVEYDASTKTAVIGKGFNSNFYYKFKYHQGNDYSYQSTEKVNFNKNSIIIKNDTLKYPRESAVIKKINEIAMKNKNSDDKKDDKDESEVVNTKSPVTTFSILKSNKTLTGLIDINGKITYRAQNRTIQKINDNLFKVGTLIPLNAQTSQLFGLMNKNGKLLTEIEYDYIDDKASNGYIRLIKGKQTDANKKVGIYDINGKEVIPVKYDNIENISDNVFSYNEAGKVGYIELNGTNHQFRGAKYLGKYQDGMAEYYTDETINGITLKGIVDKNFDVLIEPSYQAIKYLNDNIFATFASNTWGLVTAKGEVIGTARFDKAYPFINDIAIAKNNNKYFLINKQSDTISKEYDGIKVINQNQYAYNVGGVTVQDDVKGGKWGVMDKKGNIITEAIFDDIAINKEQNQDLTPVCINYDQNKQAWGMLKPDGNYLVNPQYASLNNFADGLAVFKNSENLYGAIDKQGKIVIKAEYLFLDNFANGYAKYKVTTKSKTNKEESKFGIIDKKGKIIIKANYFKIGEF